MKALVVFLCCFNYIQRMEAGLGGGRAGAGGGHGGGHGGAGAGMGESMIGITETESEKKDKQQCFEKPNEELRAKLKECIKEVKKELNKIPLPGGLAASHKVPPGSYMVKSCYYKKLGIVSEDFKECYVEKIQESIGKFDLPDEDKQKILDDVEECKNSDTEFEVDKRIPKEVIDVVFPPAAKEAAGKFQCIKDKLSQVCSDFDGGSMPKGSLGIAEGAAERGKGGEGGKGKGGKAGGGGMASMGRRK